MNPALGFTIGGFVVVLVIVMMVFSSLDFFTSDASENSVKGEIKKVANMDDPEICLNFDNPNECITSFSVLKKNPQLCVDYIEDEELEYACLSDHFRAIQDRVCNYVSDSFYEQCLIDAKDFEGFF